MSGELPLYDTILLPVDGSNRAEEAAEHGLQVAKLCDATVHVLYVVQPLQQSTVDPAHELGPVSEADLEETRIAFEKVGEQATAAIAETANQLDLETVTAVQRGFADETILDYIDDHDIDLVVMGTHGRTGLSRYFLGSVTERVIRSAPIPVLVLRPSEPE
ncbi:universal stress protein [Haladaptatus halobius]|uniref:universal stress protein n=1 Tax=Haladaptatus halobius TaxID=2884875 RepID=UPI001D0BA910|nr:universal stress protein [Haladaptatus halobius]